MATAIRKGAPGNRRLEFMFFMAGRRGRSQCMEFTPRLATAHE
jgi:hypothetical protein